MDSGCLGNHMSLQVPATTSGGPSGDTGERVSLSRVPRKSVYVIVRKLVNVKYMFDVYIRKCI